jgi:dienelactone hydrolase
MAMKNKPIKEDALYDFDCQQLSFLGKSKPVYIAGQGPAVIVMSEMPGIYERVIGFARQVRDAGFTVLMPSLFGEPGRAPAPGYTVRSMARACISREFRVLAANRSSPIVDWLRALARYGYASCGEKGVGAVGMCFTGNFAINLMLEPCVLAPVLSQPSLPLGKAAGLNISAEELARVKQRLNDEDLTVLAYRFAGDSLCKAERFAAYQAALGNRFCGRELPDEAARPGTGMNPHSVVTLHLIDEEGQPTRQALDEMLEFFQLRLKP